MECASTIRMDDSLAHRQVPHLASRIYDAHRPSLAWWDAPPVVIREAADSWPHDAR